MTGRTTVLLFASFLATLTAACRSAPNKPDEFPHKVHFELGDSEFVGLDGIEIREVWGTAPQYRPGESYLVRETYRLDSLDTATLLLSTTATSSQNSGPTEPKQSSHVARGSGDFELVHKMPTQGYPHLTFYKPSGSPFGGIYFGTGDTVLRDKRWNYAAP